MNRTVLMLAAALLAAPLAFAHSPEGTPKPYCETGWKDWREHDYGPASGGQFSFTFYDGNLEDCDGDTVPYDADGHYEYAAGGAWFPVDSGDGVTYGTVACFGVAGHHPAFGPFTVFDATFGFGTSFTVGADTFDGTGLNPVCGDGFMDNLAFCVGTCTVTFPPGLDGSYYVTIDGTVGHAYSP